jgi:hypothetical protein
MAPWCARRLPSAFPLALTAGTAAEVELRSVADMINHDINHNMMNLYAPPRSTRLPAPAQHPASRTPWGWVAWRRQRRAYARSLQIEFW